MAYSGVVRIESDSGRGSAVLIDDQWLLTAAHVVQSAPAWRWDVIFERGWFDATRDVAEVILHDGYTAQTGKSDLALVRLKTEAPAGTDIYPLYTSAIRPGTQVSLEGYGDRQASDSYGFWTGVPLLQISYNTVDTDTRKLGLDDDFGLVFDYDYGSSSGDTLGTMFGLPHLGLASREGFIGHGDSGGGLFVNGQLAGTISHMIEYNNHPVDGGYGEVGLAQSIAYYHDWIAAHVPSIQPLVVPDLPPADKLFNASHQQASEVALLYEAALNRRPDFSGLNYWVDQLESGQNLEAIADGFLYAPEFGGYPNHHSSYVDRLYINVLGRAAESEGKGYWLGALEAGMSEAEVLLRFSDSAENRQQASDWLPGLQQSYSGDWFIG